MLLLQMIGPSSQNQTCLRIRRLESPGNCFDCNASASRNLSRRTLWTGLSLDCLLACETVPPSPDTDESCLRPRRVAGSRPPRLGLFHSAYPIEEVRGLRLNDVDDPEADLAADCQSVLAQTADRFLISSARGKEGAECRRAQSSSAH